MLGFAILALLAFLVLRLVRRTWIAGKRRGPNEAGAKEGSNTPRRHDRQGH